MVVRLADPEKGGEGGTGLFAHYVWNAGVLAAEMIMGLDGDGEEGAREMCQKRWRRKWKVEGEDVLELGAGEFFLLVGFDWLLCCFLITTPWTKPTVLKYLNLPFSAQEIDGTM